MFDSGFAELIVIGVVALLVVGPERLPETVRTASLWLNRIRRGFNDIKREVKQELHNDSVMQELRKTGEELKHDAAAVHQDLKKTAEIAKKEAPGVKSSEPGDNSMGQSKE
ncbi:MAG: twin-arginine translocase subunit TatB [Halieaceae bacterium]|nr:twin-arginine translocase subunit TatB [Halieaceae bacterium]